MQAGYAMAERRFSILVADENPACREAFREALEPEGYGVLGASSGRETIDIIRSERIHVIVMELRLPDYSGVEIYHAIKDIREAFLPCIFTSIEPTARSLQEVLSEDAVTILPKPVEGPRLVQAVGRSIRRYYARGGRGAWRRPWRRTSG